MMAEDGRRVGSSFSSGLAVLLSGKEHSDKSHFVSCYDDIGSDRSLERTLEYIFDLHQKPVPSSVDVGAVRSILKEQRHNFKGHTRLDGITYVNSGSGGTAVHLDETSICGELKVLQQPLLVESFAVFSSARADACVLRGKWMYEVVLETSGIQQLGWTTVACQFTDRKGVGDAEDSYAFDGKRVSKWNKSARAYGQPWVVGDVIGCCIDLEACEISFYRNGISLGVAFEGIRRIGIGMGYYPAISLSEGERCDVNFGGRPFRYPVTGFLPLQSPPASNSFADYLLQCLSRLLDVQSADRSDSTSFERLRWLKRFAPMENLYYPISHGICGEFFSVIEEANEQSRQYISWGPLASFMLHIFKKQAPHDYATLDLFLGLFLEFPSSHSLIPHVLTALSFSCRTTPLVLMDCPFSASYPYLALACNILRHQDMMVLWWKSAQFEYSFEGFLSRKSPNKMDLQYLIPSVWWPGYSEDMASESSMALSITALSGAMDKIELQQRELCLLVIRFVPPAPTLQSTGSVFRTFLWNLILRNRVAEQKVSVSGLSGNSAVVSLYMVILHLLSEGYSAQNKHRIIEGLRLESSGFLHRGGTRSFPVALFFDVHHADVPRLGGSFNSLLKSCPIEGAIFEEICWDEGCFDDEDTRVTHSTRQKPCCCSSPVLDCPRALKDPIRYAAKACKAPCTPIPERPSHVASECSTGGLDDDISNKPSTSGSSESDLGFRSVLHTERIPRASDPSSDALRDEELLDNMLLLYHMGVTPNFKQASYYMSHQSQSISLLDETDKQIREKTCSEQLKRLKEARNVYREELADCVRQCAWYRVTLFSWWKLRGMYASCMWIVELLLTLSKDDTLFSYIPQFYIDALVDCFHALRRSDPPFVSSTVFIKQGLTSFVTFIVTHFDDQRISSADLKDLLLQSISVLVQYKDYLSAFETNRVSIQRMPRALLSAFDHRSWILVTNILVRLCKGSGFGSSKHGESSSSILFQGLIRDACLEDEELFSCFLNRLFNTLSWTMTEFSVSIREIQESAQIAELQQRKCSAIFDLSCSLTRILEFCTQEIPQVFLIGPDMNLRRLTELIVFVLNHVISAVDSEFFDMTLRRYGQNPDKTNRALILAPLVGIILNLIDATSNSTDEEQHDIISMFTSMDCPTTIHCGFQYLLGYNWGNVLKGDAYVARLDHLEQFLGALVSRAEVMLGIGGSKEVNNEEDDSCCCICYASTVDAQFEPCQHTSCFGCITRHLLNSQRCFFCNATVVEVVKLDAESPDS